jgi:hypothetical protein
MLAVVVLPRARLSGEGNASARVWMDALMH